MGRWSGNVAGAGSAGALPPANLRAGVAARAATRLGGGAHVKRHTPHRKDGTMTRSIFDPGGGETKRRGSTPIGPEAANASRMPPSVGDGEAGADQAPTLEAIDRTDDTPAPMAA